ncbi:hypothetical protein SAMN05216359_103451 [Roseateles sp. YR242]|nr:hypothetical protein SAMN05216359_103451 [Roseateles sp. YR242]
MVNVEKQAIEDAFAAEIGRAYQVMLAAYIAAEGDAKQQDKAADKFRSLVVLAREVKGRAEGQL